MRKQPIQPGTTSLVIKHPLSTLPSARNSSAALMQRALEDPSGLIPAEVKTLQRIVGNQGIQRLLAQGKPLPHAVQRLPSLTAFDAKTETSQPVFPLNRTINHSPLQRVSTEVGAVVQRSLWDDIQETVSSASDWLSSGETPVETPSQESDTPLREPEVAENELEQATEEIFEDDFDANPDSKSDPQDMEPDSWFDSWYAPDQTVEDSDDWSDTDTELAMYDTRNQSKCSALSEEVQRLDDLVRYLYELAESLLPEVESAKSTYESLQRTSPGSAQLAEARLRYESLLGQYNEIVDRCLEAMAERDALRAKLSSCKADENRDKGKMQEGVPNS